MCESEIVQQIDERLWQRLPAENASDVIICTQCSALVYNKAPSRDHHAAWHERLFSEAGSRQLQVVARHALVHATAEPIAEHISERVWNPLPSRGMMIHEGHRRRLQGCSGRIRSLASGAVAALCCCTRQGPLALARPEGVTVWSLTVITGKIAALTLAAMLAAGCGSAATSAPTPKTSLTQSLPTQSVVSTATSSTSPSPSTSPTPTPTPRPTLTHSAAPPPAPPALPATTSPAAPPAASCYPTTSSGHCYEPGEYCRKSDHGASGVAGDGEKIICEDNNGWRWEPA